MDRDVTVDVRTSQEGTCIQCPTCIDDRLGKRMKGTGRRLPCTSFRLSPPARGILLQYPSSCITQEAELELSKTLQAKPLYAVLPQELTGVLKYLPSSWIRIDA